VVYNLFTLVDPFVDRPSHDRFVDIHRNDIRFRVISIPKPICGHTCDMAFSTKYLNDIIFAITHQPLQ